MPISTSILRLVTVFLFISSPVQPQEQVDSLSGGLRVGITEAPPFVIKKGSDYTGLSMRSWELVQEELNLPYKIMLTLLWVIYWLLWKQERSTLVLIPSP